MNTSQLSTSPPKRSRTQNVGHPALGPTSDPAARPRTLSRRISRLIDVAVAALLLAMLAAPMLLVAALVKLTSRGPALYKQERSGLGGKTFVIFKFRTMCDDAEAQTGPIWSMRGDPRCTWLGNVLRRFSIDELPQLINVMRGEMSLVGPRPERPYFVDKFSRELPNYRRRLDVLPGITGWAQINGWRGDSSLEKRLDFDLHYIQHWSVPFNLGILLLTPLRVMVENNPQPDPGVRFALCPPLLLVLLVAALLQTVHIVRATTISADGIIFISIARDLPGHVVETMHSEDQHPGYPAMILAATRCAQWLGYRAEPQAWMVGSVAVSFACGLMCVVLVWLLARNVFGSRVANVSAAVFAVLPVPIANAADAQSDIPHLAFYLAALCLASSGLLTGRLIVLGCAAAASGIAYWIRPEGLEVVLITLACLVWQSFRADWSWGRLALAGGVMAGIILAIAAPYALLAGKITSKQLPFAKPHPVQTYLDQVATNEATAPTAPAPTPEPSHVRPSSDAPATAASVALADRPARYTLPLVLRTVWRGFAEFIECLCQGLKYVFIPFYLMGHVAMARRPHEAMHVALLGGVATLHFLALMGVYLISGYIAARHVLPLVAVAMPLTGLGIFFLGEKLARWTNFRPAVGVLATLGLAAAIVLPWTTRAVNREFAPVIRATHWVQSHAERGAGIVCNSPYVGFYGTLPTAVLGPHALTLDAAVAQAPAAARYDYVVLHVGAHAYRPDWLAQVERRYRQVAEFPDPTGDDRRRKVLVFESHEAQARRANGKSHS